MANKSKRINHPIISISVVSFLCACIGAASGWFFGRSAKTIEFEKGKLTFDNKIYQEYYDYVKENGGDAEQIDFSKLNSLFSETDLAFVSWYQFAFLNKKANMQSYCLADSLGINKQYTFTNRTKENNKYFREAISSASIVMFAERTYSNNISNEESIGYSYYRTIDKNNLVFDKDECIASTKFEDAPTSTYKDAKALFEEFYTNPEFPCVYDLKDEFIQKDGNNNYITKEISSVLSTEETKHTYTTNIIRDEDGYKISLLLSKDAASDYSHYMMTTTRDASFLAKMKEPPKFKDIGIELYTDLKFNLISARVDETYDVEAFTTASTVASSKYLFSTDESISIPDLSKSVDYSGLKEIL